MDGSQYCRKSENLVIATKTRQFLRETLFAGFPYKSSTLIPVLHGVTFEEVKEYSGILTDLAEFTTARDSINVIAEKIAAVVQ
ncbi:hypothetical protein [Alcaligenes endophyticus]|uniref:Uncharacterized protein n=1 Tax=Alcaligenes endophyticus TaxID=1929088 RepID=A0ABT8EGA2_9BURK|nr:hypothetical protein [Alcaligenes endophyticus]MCX5590013.1 hypothetical protein [Alcaligenes endophyticus]MDN4120324.1 hypothetical protein [Alcaligenes endophyticus]